MKKHLLLISSLLISAFSLNAQNVEISVPAGDSLFVGLKVKHYVAFTEQEPVDVTLGEEKDTYYFDLSNSTQYSFKAVSTDKTVEGFKDHVSYSSKFTLSSSVTSYSIDLTGSDDNGTPYLDMAAGEVKSYLNKDLTANSKYNVADIYLNGTYTGNVSLTPLDEEGNPNTFQIVNLRNWQITDNVINNYFLEPDYHYTVLDENGNVSDAVLSVDANGSVTVNEGVTSGDAIVLVTYDALKAPNQLGGSDVFSSIWPENTGVLVFSVRESASSEIVPNMTIHSAYNTDDTHKQSAANVDSELDVFYYTLAEGSYKYTFTPENVVSVEIANPVLSETAMSYNGFTAVEMNEDGSYTLSLTEGRNIVKLVGKSDNSYYVLKAKPVEMSVVNNTTGDNTAFANGDNVTVTFSTLYHPVNKLAGVYNMYAQVFYQDTLNNAEISGTRTQYLFAVTENAQSLTFDIAAADGADEFALTDGRIQCTMWGDPYGNHRAITYTVGKDPNLNADSHTASFAGLPEIVINLTPEVTTKQIAEEGDYVLDVSQMTETGSTTAVEFDESGVWTGCYDAVTLSYDISTFYHTGTGSASAGGYYSGYVPANNGDATDHYVSSSGDWLTYQWGNMAGYGVAMTDDGLSVYEDANGVVQTKDAAPYLVSYLWSEKAVASGSGKISFSKNVTPKGAYVAIAPWSYYGAVHGDGFAQAFTSEDDFMDLIVIGYKNNTETGRDTLRMLGYADGAVYGTTVWTWFDMSALGEVDAIDFCYDGSDYSDYGTVYLNTATYFCMDKLVVTPKSPLDNNETVASDEVMVVRAGEYLYNVEAGSTIYLFDVSGSVLSVIKNAEGQVHLPVTQPNMIIKVMTENNVQTLR